MNVGEEARTLSLAAVLGFTACANGTLPQRGKQHPGHPAAREGYAEVEPGALAEDSGQRHGDPSGSRGAATIYVCPMHPEVVASTPATCPKCGMTLVPQPAPPKPSPTATP